MQKVKPARNISAYNIAVLYAEKKSEGLNLYEMAVFSFWYLRDINTKKLRAGAVVLTLNGQVFFCYLEQRLKLPFRIEDAPYLHGVVQHDEKHHVAFYGERPVSLGTQLRRFQQSAPQRHIGK
jgi:hypothetical protein